MWQCTPRQPYMRVSAARAAASASRASAGHSLPEPPSPDETNREALAGTLHSGACMPPPGREAFLIVVTALAGIAFAQWCAVPFEQSLGMPIAALGVIL